MSSRCPESVCCLVSMLDGRCATVVVLVLFHLVLDFHWFSVGGKYISTLIEKGTFSVSLDTAYLTSHWQQLFGPHWILQTL